jgi:putative membrane protein insertion efficiency factor
MTANPAADERRRSGPVARVLLAMVRFYRTAISPALPPSCRYTPSCSAYAVEAIELHGAGRGSWLALRRLLRCHPFHAGGHDPVPLPVASAGSMTRSTTRPAQPAA